MKLQLNATQKPHCAVLMDDVVVIKSVVDGVDLLGNADYLGAKRVITKGAHFSDAFWDLRTGLAGEILQKFANYRMKLTIEGDWSSIESKALRDFIRECNRGNAIEFSSGATI